MKKTLFSCASLLSMTAIFLFQSCSNEEPVKVTDFEGQNKIGTTKVSYELEAISFQDNLEQGDDANFNFLDEIAGETMVSRQAVDITVHNDGNVEYLIEEKQPQRISLPPSSEGVPPNDIPQIVKTKASNGPGSC